MITVLQQPQNYTPAGNPVIWQMKSDLASIVYFKVELMDYLTGGIINTLQIFPLPNNTTGSYLNLSKLLETSVTWEFHNDAYTTFEPIIKSIRGYKIKITEMYLNNDSIVANTGSTYTSAINYVFDGKLMRTTFDSFTSNVYQVGIFSNVYTRFLTSKPNYSSVNDASAEMLYFLYNKNLSDLSLRIRTYNQSNTLLATYTQGISSLNFDMYRLNISPKALQFALSVSFTGVAYYQVDLVSTGVGGIGTVVRSESRTYIYSQIPCNMEYVNLLWQNEFGGFDSYQFLNPQEKTDVTSRFTIKRNVYGIDNEVYGDVTNGVLNPSDININTHLKGTVTAISDQLKDAEAYWLQTLFSSKQVLMELSDFKVIPVSLVNTSYNIPRLRYVKGTLNNISIEFTLAEGILPSAVNYISSVANYVVFSSTTRTAIFFKNDCASGTIGSFVPYTIAGGTYKSTVSVADANRKRDMAIEANGQAYSNAHGSCSVASVGNDAKSQDFTRNNCNTNEFPSTVTYTVNANTYYAATKADANQLAQDDINANGQTYANTYGTCSLNNNYNITVGLYQRENNTGTDKEIYLTAYASSPVNTFVTIQYSYTVDGSSSTIASISIDNGNVQSTEQFVASVPAGAIVEFSIYGVSPSSYQGVTYSF